MRRVSANCCWRIKAIVLTIAMRCSHRFSLAANRSRISREGMEPLLRGWSIHVPRMYPHDRSTKSQLLAQRACLRNKRTISVRRSACVVGCSRFLGIAAFISSTRRSRPHRRASCHGERRRDEISSKEMLRPTILTTDLVCGTFSPKNLSPSPYCPFPVLKNRDRMIRCLSSAIDCKVDIISRAVVMSVNKYIDYFQKTPCK